MKKVVDKKKLKQEIGDLSSQEIGGVPHISCVDVENLIDSCPLSPAEFGGDSWVLGELKISLGASFDTFKTVEYGEILERIEYLESQVPISELAKQAKEHRRKAEAWDKLKKWIAREYNDVTFIAPIRVQEKMDELLAQEESNGNKNYV